MVFKVQNLPRTVTRFEEYREVVKSRAGNGGESAAEKGGEDHARCVADGNEVMRFYCLGPTNGGAYENGNSAWTFSSGKGAAVCTYSGSGAAHENAGGGRGRRAMLVCRVIAGRVGKQLGFDSLIEGRVGYDSVSGDSGELLVFDSRAVLPCFLIIYKL
uniref:PARP catalytic domain-containing protein n=2 Tax=Solanum lycopersicum TaxID=4081 RepID=A0A3Q7HV13_SOLLC